MTKTSQTMIEHLLRGIGPGRLVEAASNDDYDQGDTDGEKAADHDFAQGKDLWTQLDRYRASHTKKSDYDLGYLAAYEYAAKDLVGNRGAKFIHGAGWLSKDPRGVTFKPSGHSPGRHAMSFQGHNAHDQMRQYLTAELQLDPHHVDVALKGL